MVDNTPDQKALVKTVKRADLLTKTQNVTKKALWSKIDLNFFVTPFLTTKKGLSTAEIEIRNKP